MTVVSVPLIPINDCVSVPLIPINDCVSVPLIPIKLKLKENVIHKSYYQKYYHYILQFLRSQIMYNRQHFQFTLQKVAYTLKG